MKTLFPKLEAYRRQLIQEEHSAETIKKYLREIEGFLAFLPSQTEITKESVLLYKREISRKYKATTGNGILVAVNSFLDFIKLPNYRVKLFKVQRQTFRSREKELTRTEYARLVKAARHKKQERLALLVEAICTTGIRVSEHRYITVESLRSGRMEILNKGKIRTVLLPPELREKLHRHCSKQGITSGSVFITRGGKPLDRSNIWVQMKRLCQDAKVEAQKVFPHNLRHLFAVTFYQLEKDIVRLADILGHSSVETTRIYTAVSAEEQLQSLSRLRLLIQ